MKKYFLTIIISLLVGFLLSNYAIKKYDASPITIPVFNENTKAYLIQQGVYSSYESMQKNTSNLTDYIYSNIDNMFYVYIGLTLNEENVIKLQEYYKSKNIPTIVKTTTLTDYNLISSLKQYDTILKETSDSATIREICKQVLSKYKGD